MHYISTRGASPPVDFATAMQAGLAPDGGLYVPSAFPTIAPIPPGLPYAEAAARVLGAFAGDSFTPEEIGAFCSRAYSRFAHSEVAPLVQTGPAQFMMELHHGPTLAFKDVAMQVIAEMLDALLARQGKRVTLVCATSGDTGGAAAFAFAGLERINLVILHPHERISPVQRLFMTTTGAPNITNLAITGDFDDAQAIVKALFADRDFAARVNLAGVNSINWARIAAQSVYYATAQATLGPQHSLRFVVPTGNFGDALAGWVAGQCGLLGGGFRALAAVNANRTLDDVFKSGDLFRTPALATLSPAMDIAVPSNLERLLFEACGRDGTRLSGLYNDLSRKACVPLPAPVHAALQASGIATASVDDQQTRDALLALNARTGILVCPHAAVGFAAAQRHPSQKTTTDVILATAHPAKFPETLKAVTGQDIPLPVRCGSLQARPEVFETMAPDLDRIRDHILTTAHA